MEKRSQLGMWRPDPPECGIKLRAMPEYVFDASWLPASDVIASAQAQFAAVEAALELSAAVLPPTSTSTSAQARPIAKLVRGARRGTFSAVAMSQPLGKWLTPKRAREDVKSEPGEDKDSE